MKAVLGLFRRVWKADSFSPTAFLVRAATIAVFFLVSELAGLREYTTFLSGTSGSLNVSWQTAATLGLIHLLLSVGFILVVPIFLITAGLLALWNKWSKRQRPPEESPRSRQGKYGLFRILKLRPQNELFL